MKLTIYKKFLGAGDVHDPQPINRTTGNNIHFEAYVPEVDSIIIHKLICIEVCKI